MSEWTQPKDWSTDELVTATMLNTHLRDNLNALKAPPSDQIIHDNAGVYSTSSAAFVAIDSTNLAITLDTNGGDVLVWFSGVFRSSGPTLGLDVLVDGSARVGSAEMGLVAHGVSANNTWVALPPVIVSGLAAGEHTFEIAWRVNGTGTIYLNADANDGTTSRRVLPLLVAREVS